MTNRNKAQALADALGDTKSVKVPIELGFETHANKWGLGMAYWYATKEAGHMGQRAYVFSFSFGPFHLVVGFPRKRWLRVPVAQNYAAECDGASIAAQSPGANISAHGGHGGAPHPVKTGGGGGGVGGIGAPAARGQYGGRGSPGNQSRQSSPAKRP